MVLPKSLRRLGGGVSRDSHNSQEETKSLHFHTTFFMYTEKTLICKLVKVHFPGPMNMNEKTRTKNIVITINSLC